MFRVFLLFGPILIGLIALLWIGGSALATTFQMMARARRARVAAWQAFANGNQLHFRPAHIIGDPIQISGVYLKRPLLILTYATSPQDQHDAYTRITLDIANPGNISLRLRERGMFDPLERMPGTDVVEVGNTVFDRTFFIESQPHTAAAKIFSSPYIRQRVRQQTLIRFEINHRQLLFEKFGALRSAEDLQGLLNLLSDVAQVVQAVQA